ncbi:pyrophosphate--fructose 6-phosphate 1-phosphotransferase subunit beta [Sesamum indicum]|uniref:Pyrophosphate--fructose 6-phosphate 1-phosphotransferase subunit beta n=1 Tax=Sesamum indicum TaxID=4182 RepID=A0A8M8UT31_SESIN|nr:pyrophosphate--fructose 6-phosphate 1-phosphotransferase subunit beta [Sesamum indicum]
MLEIISQMFSVNVLRIVTTKLIAELNEILSHDVVDEGGMWKKKLGSQSLKLFEILPQAIQEQLLLERDPHGNVQVIMLLVEWISIDYIS